MFSVLLLDNILLSKINDARKEKTIRSFRQIGSIFVDCSHFSPELDRQKAE